MRSLINTLRSSRPRSSLNELVYNRPDLHRYNSLGPDDEGQSIWDSPVVTRYIPNGGGGQGGAPASTGAPQGVPTQSASQGGSTQGTRQASSMGGAGFNQKSVGIMNNLMRDFNLQPHQAAAILGNLGAETGGFTQNQEISPRSGRGGLGWAQWTGPRRVDFENYAQKNNFDTKSDDANYGFLKNELQTKYAGAINNLRNTTDLPSATHQFEKDFEGAGVKNYPARDNYSNQALAAYQKSQTTPASADSSQQPGVAAATASNQVPNQNRLITKGDTSRLNPVLLSTMQSASNHLPTGYTAELTSGDRPGSRVAGGGGTSQHASGNAMDVQIRGPDGKVIPNRGTDTTGMYGYLARAAHHELSQSHPEMNGQLAWGGNFGVGKGSTVADLMHYDLGKDRGQLGGMGASPLAAQVALHAKDDNFTASPNNTQMASAHSAPPIPPPTSAPPNPVKLTGALGVTQNDPRMADLKIGDELVSNPTTGLIDKLIHAPPPVPPPVAPTTNPVTPPPNTPPPIVAPPPVTTASSSTSTPAPAPPSSSSPPVPPGAPPIPVLSSAYANIPFSHTRLIENRRSMISLLRPL